MARRVTSTKKQRDELLKCNIGVGFLVYRSGPKETCEFEFYIDRKGNMKYIQSGTLVEFNLIEDYEGN